jgi:hypothetical protein
MDKGAEFVGELGRDERSIFLRTLPLIDEAAPLIDEAAPLIDEAAPSNR